MESNSLGPRGLRLKLYRKLAHAELPPQTNISKIYLRQHIWRGRGSHLDRCCEKREGLSFAHEGQRMVAGVKVAL